LINFSATDQVSGRQDEDGSSLGNMEESNEDFIHELDKMR
jgi:hypothetical protein